jgi:hypothetical protein
VGHLLIQVKLADSAPAGQLPVWVMLAVLITAGILPVHMKPGIFMVINSF